MHLLWLLQRAGLGFTLAHLAAAQELRDRKLVSRRWSALGDSYSAGPGAGLDTMNDRPGEKCHRGDRAFPIQLNLSPALSTNTSAHSFSFLACTEAVTDDLLGDGTNSQIKTLQAGRPGDEDVVTITIGANDVGLGNIARVCLYGEPFSNQDCEGEKARTKGKIEALHLKLVETYKAIIGNESTRMFLLYAIGYPKWFGTDLTKECDDFHFGIFPGNDPGLTVAVRREINDMIDGINAKVRQAVEMVNQDYGFEKARYVDSDTAFHGHRFCERDQGHPSQDKPETWFFMYGGTDIPTDPSDPHVAESEPEPEPGEIMTPSECTTLLARNDITLGGELGRVVYCSLRLGESQGLVRSPWLRSDGGNSGVGDFVRLFHPKTAGHTAIKNAIVQDIQSLPEKRLHPVLVMHQGSVESFNDMIDSLPAPPPLEFGGTRVTRRWDEHVSHHNVRGYSTWLTPRQGWDVQQQRDVLGVSYLIFDEPPPLPRAGDRSEEVLLPQNETHGQLTDQFTASTPKDRHDHEDPLVLQFDSEEGGNYWHLAYLAKPPRFVGKRYYEYPGYTFQWEGGHDVDIYILDTGLAGGVDFEFTHPNPAYNNRIPRHFEAVGTRQGRIDRNGHGTAMAGLAAGRRVGVARAASIIPVKIAEPGYGSFTVTRLFQGLQWILSDRGGKDKASVLNLSFSMSPFATLNPYYGPYDGTNLEASDPFFHFLPLLAQRGVIAVCSAGNDGAGDDKIYWRSPSRHAMPESTVAADTLIVVGATGNQGREASFSNKFSAITTYAPGVNLTLLQPDNQIDCCASGTSGSTALTSGLIATFLARPDLATELGLKEGGSLLNTVKLVKTFVKKAAQYATDPDKGRVHVLGTYNYVPCDDETQPLNTDPGRPVVRQMQAKQTYKVPNTRCVGPSNPAGYKYAGCLGNPHQLAFNQGPVKGVKECADKCSQGEFEASKGGVLMGLSDGVCYCDVKPLRAPGIEAAPEPECDAVCSDGSVCGGNKRMSLYTTTGTLTWQTSVTGWGAKGCYLESGEILLDGDHLALGDSLGPEKCADLCRTFNFFGLQSGQRGENICYCGNVLRGDDGGDNVQNCNRACPADQLSLCGGDTALSVYVRDDPVVV